MFIWSTLRQRYGQNDTEKHMAKVMWLSGAAVEQGCTLVGELCVFLLFDVFLYSELTELLLLKGGGFGCTGKLGTVRHDITVLRCRCDMYCDSHDCIAIRY